MFWLKFRQVTATFVIQSRTDNVRHVTNCLKHPSWTDTLQCLSLPDSLNYLLHFLQKITPSWTDTSWCLSVLDSLNYLSHYTKNDFFMNWHLMMSQCTWFIKLFVTLYTKNDFFVNWHLMMSEFTCIMKSFITLFTIKMHPWRFLKKVDTFQTS